MHPKFPYGKGMWIWRIEHCEGGSISKIIQRCKDNDISYVLIKSGDGTNSWSQWNAALVKSFHDAGIKIYSWTYCYGLNPMREAAIAQWSLNLGADGHVFDAEGEYERLSGNAAAANMMLSEVRRLFPTAFLAHAPFPIIDYHAKFPYREFGKYCDAIMPQMYWGTMGRTPEDIVKWTYQQWSKWEEIWKKEGRSDVVKPLIPIGQTYDNAQTKFKLTPKDILTFVNLVAGYQSVNFWSYQHVLRQDCWDALRQAKVNMTSAPQPMYDHGGWYDDPTDKKNKRWWVSANGKSGFLPFGIVEPKDLFAAYKHGETYFNYITGENQRWWNGAFLPVGMTVPPVSAVPAPSQSTPTSSTNEPSVPVQAEPVVPAVPEVVPVQETPKAVEPTLPASVSVPKDGQTTITMKQCDESPGGVEVKVTYQKTHLDMLLDVVSSIRNIFKRS